jgi:cytochrome c biogenesis protein CcmG, thiol:disulfide interchange protein DsbE
MRRLLVLVAAVGLVAVVVIGLTQVGGQTGSDGTDFDLPAAKRTLATAPAPLNGLYAQANELIGGGQKAFDDRIESLKGTPLVVNKWASWCGPCQAEFSVFQAATLKHGKEVGFIGLNSEDADPKARRFLASRPLPFPSYTDPKSKVAYARQIAAGFPMTLFIGRDGKTAFTHTGQYTSEAQLSKDIERYLG